MVLVLLLPLGLVAPIGCGGLKSPQETLKPAKPARFIPERMGYTIQVGAFSNVGNAARLTQSLKKQGLEAYYFVYRSNLYKVRFGNFETDAAARKRAEHLRSAGMIEEYFIVSPRDYSIAREQQFGSDYVRDHIVSTAQSYLGVPYLWGGNSRDEGLDCSGLTAAVYSHNGIVLPRTSADQFESGITIDKSRLQKGDLVFFAVTGPAKVSHVGIYTGQGFFIHAPGRGKVISTESLSSPYFMSRYTGARRYLE